jgi:hypothetical protein
MSFIPGNMISPSIIIVPNSQETVMNSSRNIEEEFQKFKKDTGKMFYSVMQMQENTKKQHEKQIAELQTKYEQLQTLYNMLQIDSRNISQDFLLLKENSTVLKEELKVLKGVYEEERVKNEILTTECRDLREECRMNREEMEKSKEMYEENRRMHADLAHFSENISLIDELKMNVEVLKENVEDLQEQLENESTDFIESKLNYYIDCMKKRKPLKKLVIRPFPPNTNNNIHSIYYNKLGDIVNLLKSGSIESFDFSNFVVDTTNQYHFNKLYENLSKNTNIREINLSGNSKLNIIGGLITLIQENTTLKRLIIDSNILFGSGRDTSILTSPLHNAISRNTNIQIESYGIPLCWDGTEHPSYSLYINNWHILERINIHSINFTQSTTPKTCQALQKNTNIKEITLGMFITFDQYGNKSSIPTMNMIRNMSLQKIKLYNQLSINEEMIEFQQICTEKGINIEFII